MTRALRTFGLLAAIAALWVVPRAALADAADDSLGVESDTMDVAQAPAEVASQPHALEPLVPEVSAHPYRLEPGVRPYRNRLCVSPGYGFFGTDKLYALRIAYNPEPWLGYEASIGHNPGYAVHAVIHTISAIVRRPRAGRLQPYLTAGYGMVIVFPGQAVNAVPVTKNSVAVGAGLEMYVRSDLAIRADLRNATVFGEQRDRQGIVAYPYSQGTIGLSFYRSVRP